MASSLKKAEKALRELGALPAKAGSTRPRRRVLYLIRIDGLPDRTDEHPSDEAALAAFRKDVRGIADGRIRLWRVGETKRGRLDARQALLKDVTVKNGEARPTPTLLEG